MIEAAFQATDLLDFSRHRSRTLWVRNNPTLEKINAISPQVADEIATRYATNKIYTTKAVAEAYPQMERALLHDGSEADLGDLAADAEAEGYEFGGDRVKRPMKRRVVIPAQTGAPAP